MSSSDDEEEENDIAYTSDSSDEQNEWHLDEDLGQFLFKCNKIYV